MGKRTSIPIAEPSANGGHVYPAVGDDGLSVLDYFAGQALAGLTMGADFRVLVTPAAREDLSARCFEIADAMLAMRAKRTGG